MTAPEPFFDTVPAPLPALPAGMKGDIAGSVEAMRRAARRARKVAQQTDTDLIVLRNGCVVRVHPAKENAS